MKDEGVEDSVRWTLEQLKTPFPAMVKQAGYEQIAEKIDQRAIADKPHSIRAGNSRQILIGVGLQP